MSFNVLCFFCISALQRVLQKQMASNFVILCLIVMQQEDRITTLDADYCRSTAVLLLTMSVSIIIFSGHCSLRISGYNVGVVFISPWLRRMSCKFILLHEPKSYQRNTSKGTLSTFETMKTLFSLQGKLRSY